MNRLTFGNVAGTVVWIASAIKMFGYTWQTFQQSYSAFPAPGAGSGTGSHDIPIIPPLKRKQKPGGGKTKLPRPAPLPKIPPVPLPNGPGVGGEAPVTSPSPWNIFNPDWTPSDFFSGIGDLLPF